jgi:methyltransferase (TIGR00027 family)
MPEALPSPAARRVAAIRLSVDRLAAPHGDPAADEALSRDVAGGISAESPAGQGELTVRYLQGRTRFIDRVIVNAMTRQIGQVVLVGAGYDGRSLRYAKPGVRWWEVDQADALTDKRDRLRRLRIHPAQVTYIDRDPDAAGLAASLVASGFEPDAPAIFVCETVALYLGSAALSRLLSEFRSLATPGTRLSVCLPFRALTAEVGDSPERLPGSQAAPDGTNGRALSGDLLAGLLGASRWRSVVMPEPARRAGFAVAAPVWAPASAVADAAASPSLGRIAGFAERVLYRAGEARLAGHLESAYGATVRRVRELDLGVHRVDLADGRTWIARVFPASRDVIAAEDDARVLGWLAEQGFPAERCAEPDPVSVHEGQGVLVTDFASGRLLAAKSDSFELLGGLLGRLHCLSADLAAARRPGGAWHHLLPGASPADEAIALGTLLHDARHRVPAAQASRYDALVAAVGSLDGCADLPHAFVHPDFVPRNVIRATDGSLVVIDWAGCGFGPRVVSLGCLLWTAGTSKRSVTAAVAGYRESITIEPSELDRLEAAMLVRPLVLACWMFATGRDDIRGAADYWDEHRRRIGTAAGYARAAFGAAL